MYGDIVSGGNKGPTWNNPENPKSFGMESKPHLRCYCIEYVSEQYKKDDSI